MAKMGITTIQTPDKVIAHRCFRLGACCPLNVNIWWL